MKTSSEGLGNAIQSLSAVAVIGAISILYILLFNDFILLLLPIALFAMMALRQGAHMKTVLSVAFFISLLVSCAGIFFSIKGSGPYGVLSYALFATLVLAALVEFSTASAVPDQPSARESTAFKKPARHMNDRGLPR
jgi:hypothetical protein